MISAVHCYSLLHSRVRPRVRLCQTKAAYVLASQQLRQILTLLFFRSVCKYRPAAERVMRLYYYSVRRTYLRHFLNCHYISEIVYFASAVFFRKGHSQIAQLPQHFYRTQRVFRLAVYSVHIRRNFLEREFADLILELLLFLRVNVAHFILQKSFYPFAQRRQKTVHDDGNAYERLCSLYI